MFVSSSSRAFLWISPLFSLAKGESSGIDASDIIFYVAGINGNTGNLGATLKAAKVSLTNTVDANVYVPNGTLWLRQNAKATGAFLAKDVLVGIGVEVTLDSHFGN